MSDSGFPIDYVVTPASVSDGTVAFELLENSPLSVIYGDKGYVDKQVKSHLSPYGIQLISQLRKIMAGYLWFEKAYRDRIFEFRVVWNRVFTLPKPASTQI